VWKGSMRIQSPLLRQNERSIKSGLLRDTFRDKRSTNGKNWNPVFLCPSTDTKTEDPSSQYYYLVIANDCYKLFSSLITDSNTFLIFLEDILTICFRIHVANLCLGELISNSGLLHLLDFAVVKCVWLSKPSPDPH
jgi:hypothetical protein